MGKYDRSCSLGRGDYNEPGWDFVYLFNVLERKFALAGDSAVDNRCMNILLFAIRVEPDENSEVPPGCLISTSSWSLGSRRCLRKRVRRCLSRSNELGEGGRARCSCANCGKVCSWGCSVVWTCVDEVWAAESRNPCLRFSRSAIDGRGSGCVMGPCGRCTLIG